MSSRTIVVKIKVEGKTEAEKSFNAITAAQRETERQTKALNAEMRSAEKHAMSMQIANAKLSQVQDGLTNSFIKGNLAARAISITIETLTDTLKFGVQQAVDFEFTMAKIEAIAGVSGDSLENLNKNIRNIAANSTSTAAEVADAALEMAKMGVSADDISNSLAGVVNLSIAADENVSKVGETVIQVANVFDVASKDINRLTDQIFTGIAQSALSLQSFSTAFQYAGATAAEAGVRFEELTGLMEVLSNRGLRASTIGTGLRKVLTELSDPTSKAGKAIGGVTIESVGLDEVLRRLKFAVTDVTTSKDLFGRTAQNVGLMLAQEGDAIRESIKGVDELKNKSSEASEILKNTMAGSVRELKASFSDLSISISQDFGPVISYVLRDLAGSLRDFGEGIEIIKEKYVSAIDAMFGTKNGEFISDDALQKMKQNAKDIEDAQREEAAKGIGRMSSISSADLEKDKKAKAKVEAAKAAARAAELAKANEKLFKDIKVVGEDTVDRTQISPEIFEGVKFNGKNSQQIGIDKRIAELEKYDEAWKKVNNTMLEHNEISDQWRLTTTYNQELVAIEWEALNSSIDAFSANFADSIVEWEFSFKSFKDVFKEISKEVIAQLIAMTVKLLVFKAIAAALNFSSGGVGGFAGSQTLDTLQAATAAKGMNKRANKPTLLLVGEEGPEDVLVKPRSTSAMSNGGGSNLTVQIMGDVYGEEKFTEAVRMAQYKLEKNYVGGRA